MSLHAEGSSRGEESSGNQAAARKTATGRKGAAPAPARAVDNVAAGAARAGGERARRRRKVTPLLESAAARYQAVPGPRDADSPGREVDAGQTSHGAGEADPADVPAGRPRPPRQSFIHRAPEEVDGGPAAEPALKGPPARSIPRLSLADAEREAQEVGEALVNELTPGTDQGQVTAAVAAALDFLRRRLTGDYEVDDYGFDPDLTDTVLLALLRPLYRRWFRVEVRGIENVPATGGALVVANHSGTIALDALMTQVALRDEHPTHRQLRLLGADLVFRTPVVGELARKSGTTLAANADAEALLSDGQVVGVFPEGFKGIGKPFSERYKLQRFGRGGFVSAALRTQTPIVSCAIVGAEEIYPIIARSGTAARLLNLPYAPITPTWPLLGPLGLIPLPSKWFIEFGEPIWTSELDPAGADDPMLLFDLTDRVRETIQQNLYSLLMQRKSVFF